ncbi:MAG: carbon storage regulator CsrA [Planctomycetia bacterium]
MLVLTRRAGESIHIDSNITITVLEVRGSQIRIGIDAPRDIAICRAELRKDDVGDPVDELVLAGAG